MLLLLRSRFSCVRLQRWQPTRLPCPWDPPGKNTGVGCHFLLQCMKVKSESEVTQLCWTLRDQPTRLLHPWDSPGKSAGVGCHCLLPEDEGAVSTAWPWAATRECTGGLRMCIPQPQPVFLWSRRRSGRHSPILGPGRWPPLRPLPLPSSSSHVL